MDGHLMRLVDNSRNWGVEWRDWILGMLQIALYLFNNLAPKKNL